MIGREHGNGTALGKATNDNAMPWNALGLYQIIQHLFDLFHGAQLTHGIVGNTHRHGPIEQVKPSGHAHTTIDRNGNGRCRWKDIFQLTQTGNDLW